MTKCWLCREPFTRTVPLVTLPRSIQGCPSCLTPIIAETGEMHGDTGMMNVSIALARATDRLTKQLADDADERALLRQGRNPHKP